jgi:4-alpha-glucanotransferase
MLRVQVNRGLDGKFRKLEQMIEGYRDLYLQGMADQLVLNSPVDTGTYITAHNIGTAPVAATESSEGKPRQQPYEPYAQAARNGLFLDIRTLPENANSVVFSNAAFHSDEVEYEHGYAPYRKTAREHGRVAAQAAAEAKARNR